MKIRMAGSMPLFRPDPVLWAFSIRVAPLRGLRAAGARAESIDGVIADLTVVLDILKQANLLFDADAWEQLRKMNDQVKAQGKHEPDLLKIFDPLVKYMARKRAGGGAVTPPTNPV
jgi:hypothetical protein